MNKTVIMVFLLLLCPVWAVLGQQSGGMMISVQGGEHVQPRQPLNNESIMGLVKIGFSDETIITMIEHEPGNYSLAAADVIALKQAGVSEKVIRAMLSKSAGGHAPATVAPVSQAPATATAVTGEGTTTRASSVRLELGVPTQPGLYAVVQGGSLQRIEGRVTSFVRSGSRLASTATLGIHANRINTQIPGSHASVTVSPTPAFYYRPVADEGGIDLILTLLTVKNGRRQFEVGAEGVFRKSTGVSVRHQMDFDAKQIEPGLYKIVLTHELETGQYAFYLLRGREHASVEEGRGFVYCFQVE
jgi:hypothetical protein